MVGDSDAGPLRKKGVSGRRSDAGHADEIVEFGLRRGPQIPMVEAADAWQRQYAARRKRPGLDFADTWSVLV
jgi:hypothetical protein